MELDNIEVNVDEPPNTNSLISIDSDSDTSDNYELEYKDEIIRLKPIVDMSLEEYLQKFQSNTKVGLSVEEIINKSQANLKIDNTTLLLYQGDITKLKLDAIQNTANTSLMGGDGIDGVIHSASRIGLNLECSKLDGCETGNSKITKGFDLPSKTVIHTVGPIYSDSTKIENKNELISCYKTTLELCDKYKFESVGLCCVSCGLYGYPLEEASHIAFHTILHYLRENDKDKSTLKYIVFVVFLKDELDVYLNLFNNYEPIENNSLINANSQFLYLNTFNAIAKSGYPCEISLIDGSKVSGEYICTDSDNEHFIVRNFQGPTGSFKCVMIRRCDILMMRIIPPKEVLDELIEFQCKYIFNNQ